LSNRIRGFEGEERFLTETRKGANHRMKVGVSKDLVEVEEVGREGKASISIREWGIGNESSSANDRHLIGITEGKEVEGKLGVRFETNLKNSFDSNLRSDKSTKEFFCGAKMNRSGP